MQKPILWVATVVAGFGLVLMTGPLEANEETGAGGEQATGPRIDVGGVDQPGGTIKGIVKFSGEQRKQGKIRVDADPFCHRAHKDAPLLKERFVFGKNDTLQNVFVYVSKGLENKKFEVPDRPAVLDQRGCVYVPHVNGIMVNQTLKIRTSDQTTHNIKLKSKKNGTDNNAMPPIVGTELTRAFKKAEMAVSYKCDVHPWMNAYLHVMEHPYFAVTQQNGTFEIKGLPAGEYEVSVWHEFGPFKPDKKSAPVKIADSETVELEFTYSPPKKKKKK